MTEVCQACGGRPERDTCVCGMIAQVSEDVEVVETLIAVDIEPIER